MRIRFTDLPDDMQNLLFELFDDNDVSPPEEFELLELPLSRFPDTRGILDPNRGIWHAVAMCDIIATLPPVVIWQERLLDGYHRIAASYEMERRTLIKTIDLSRYGFDYRKDYYLTFPKLKRI